MNLWPFQAEAGQTIKAKLLAGCNRQLVKWPTGLGKTVLFSSIPDVLNMRNRMMVIVHREELASQAAEELRYWNPKRSVGTEMADKHANGAQIVVAGIQTIGTKNSTRLAKFKPSDFEAIILDECQHATASTYRNVINHFNVYKDKYRLLLGVTATPNRADGVGLGEIFEEIVHDISLLSAIRDGWLVDIRGIRIKTASTLERVHTLAGDFNLNELSYSINNAARNDLIVRSWISQAENRPTVAFAVDVQHALDLAAMFQTYGVAAEAIWGSDPLRQEKLARHRSGDITVLVNCQILTEGYNDRQLSCICMARPTKSESLYTQMIGRGTRLEKGINNLLEAQRAGLKITKKDCIILDFVDGYAKHSLVTLPTLFGLGTDTNLRGRSIVSVLNDVQKIKERRPTLDITKLNDADKLVGYAEEVDLFKISYPPETVAISDFQWHHPAANHYILMLTNRESVSVVTDILERWHVIGTCSGQEIRHSCHSFEEAIRYADRKVRELAKFGVLSLISRKAKWHDDEPSLPQLAFCKQVGWAIPEGATRGDIAKRMTEWMSRRQRISA